VNGVPVVSLQAAVRTRKAHLGWTEKDAGKVQKEGYAENHDNDGYQSADRSRQSDVAEAGRRQSSHCEVEGVRIVGDIRIDAMLRLVDDSRHHENEDSEIGYGSHDLFVPPEHYTVFA